MFKVGQKYKATRQHGSELIQGKYYEFLGVRKDIFSEHLGESFWYEFQTEHGTNGYKISLATSNFGLIPKSMGSKRNLPEWW